MSAFGTKRTCRVALQMSAIGGKADISALFRKAPAATYRIGLGEQISALGNDSVAGTLDLTELSSQMPARAAMRI